MLNQLVPVGSCKCGINRISVVIGLRKERLFCPYYSGSSQRRSIFQFFEISIEKKKQAMANYSLQRLHINEKKRLEKFLSVVFFNCSMTFPKTEKIYRAIMQHSYSYNIEFTNSNCLVKRI